MTKLCECGCGLEAKNRFLKGHNSKAKGYTPEQRFWVFVNKGSEDDCWEWKGALRNGYGVMNIDHKVVYAHRFSYELHFGTTDQPNVLHKCDNRLCLNPNHLFAGTKGDNIRDMYAKGRGRGGRKEGSTPIVNEEKVRQIRQLAADGVKYPAISKQFGIGIPAVSLIVARKRWTHV